MLQTNKYIGNVDPKYLQTLALRIKPLKERSYELMHLRDGFRVLDVGCGPGTDTIPLSRLVGSIGEVVGIDIDEQMIGIANRKATEANITDRVEHKHIDAKSIPYESDYFDACRSERLFQHTLTPECILSEMIRVTKSGGWIVVVDTDHSTMTIDTPDLDIEWRLRRFRTDIARDGYIGRQLYRLFRQQGLANIVLEIYPLFSTDYSLARYLTLLDDVENEAIAADIITAEELKRWHMNLEQADKEGIFFCCINMVIVAGRKS